MSGKKDANRILNENGAFVPFPATQVAETIRQEHISSESLVSHKEAVQEIIDERKLPFKRKEQKKRNDQVKKKEEAAFTKILDS